MCSTVSFGVHGRKHQCALSGVPCIMCHVRAFNSAVLLCPGSAQAVLDYSHALALEPRNANALHNRASAQEKLGLPASALAA